MTDKAAYRRAKESADSSFSSGAYEASIVSYTSCIHDLRAELSEPAAGSGLTNALQKVPRLHLARREAYLSQSLMSIRRLLIFGVVLPLSSSV